MKVFCEVHCSKCGKKQITDVQELWKENLFWRICEFCNRYGLYRVTRYKLTSVAEWLMALYQAMDFQRVENSFLANKRK